MFTTIAITVIISLIISILVCLSLLKFFTNTMIKLYKIQESQTDAKMECLTAHLTKVLAERR